MNNFIYHVGEGIVLSESFYSAPSLYTRHIERRSSTPLALIYKERKP